MIAVETGGNLLLERAAGRVEITSQLLDRELIERQIRVQGPNHPIPPRPHRAVRVALIAIAIGKSRRIEPLQGHSFAVTRRCQQAVHRPFVGVGRIVSQERLRFDRRGRQPGKIEGNPPQQQRFSRRGRWLEPGTLQPTEHKKVDCVPRPIQCLTDGSSGRRGVTNDQCRPRVRPCAIQPESARFARRSTAARLRVAACGHRRCSTQCGGVVRFDQVGHAPRLDGRRSSWVNASRWSRRKSDLRASESGP